MYPESGSSGAFVRTVSETGRLRPAAFVGAACRRDVRVIEESGLVFGGRAVQPRGPRKSSIGNEKIFSFGKSKNAAILPYGKR